MKPQITDRSTWDRGWIAEDETNHILICTNEHGTVVGTCDTRMPPVMVKRWIVKVGEFKRVDIVNRKRFLSTWNERMVNDDDDKYRIE
jgi:hypothetical protein